MINESDPRPLLTAEFESIRDDAAILRFAGEVDLSTVSIITEQFRVIADEGLRSVVIDATDVSFMDSTGLHALIEGKRLIHETGTTIYLVPSSQVRRVLELAFPEPLFAARVDSVEEALTALERRVETPS
jgi:anti-sigma B factor antagonist